MLISFYTFKTTKKNFLLVIANIIFRLLIINMKVLNSTNKNSYNFEGYKQNFQNENFKRSLKEALSSVYTNSRKINKRVETELANLKTYKEVFKNSEFEPLVELSLNESEINGKITHYSSTPVEIKAPLNKRLKPFFKKICNISNLQVKEDILKQDIWKLYQDEKYTESLLNNRFQEITKGQKSSNPFILFYDSVYANLTEKLLKITIAKNEKNSELEKIQKKLHTYKPKSSK